MLYLLVVDDWRVGICLSSEDRSNNTDPAAQFSAEQQIRTDCRQYFYTSDKAEWLSDKEECACQILLRRELHHVIKPSPRPGTFSCYMLEWELLEMPRIWSECVDGGRQRCHFVITEGRSCEENDQIHHSLFTHDGHLSGLSRPREVPLNSPLFWSVKDGWMCGWTGSIGLVHYPTEEH